MWRVCIDNCTNSLLPPFSSTLPLSPLPLQVLSVVAQQVMDIQRAIASKLTNFTFEGTDMTLKWSAW